MSEQIRTLDEILKHLQWKSKNKGICDSEWVVVEECLEGDKHTIVKIEIPIYSSSIQFELIELSLLYFRECYEHGGTTEQPKPLDNYGITDRISGSGKFFLAEMDESSGSGWIGASNEKILWPFLPQNCPPVWIDPTVYTNSQVEEGVKNARALLRDLNPRTYSLFAKVPIILPITSDLKPSISSIWDKIVGWIAEDPTAAESIRKKLAESIVRKEYVPYTVYQQAVSLDNRSYVGCFIYEVYTQARTSLALPNPTDTTERTMELAEEHVYQVVSAYVMENQFRWFQTSSRLLEQSYQVLVALQGIVEACNRKEITPISILDYSTLDLIVDRMVWIVNTRYKITAELTKLESDMNKNRLTTQKIEDAVPYVILTKSMIYRIENRINRHALTYSGNITDNIEDIRCLFGQYDMWVTQLRSKDKYGEVGITIYRLATKKVAHTEDYPTSDGPSEVIPS